MKLLEIDQLRKLDDKKLYQELKNASMELFKVKFEVRNGQSKNIHLVDRYKKYVARVKTIQKQFSNKSSNEN